MSTKGRSTRGGGRLSEEDEALWRQVARAVKPTRAKPRVTGTEVPQTPKGSPKHQPAEKRGAGREEGPRARPHPIEDQARPHVPPPLAEFDRRTERWIGAGRIEIEARLDLHGLRQSEAHAVLRRFLLAAHARRLRVVLVITGKGASFGADEPVPALGHDTRDRGVLRRSVPRWLAEPELRRVVVSHTAAHARHGGDGAIYVHLRKPR